MKNKFLLALLCILILAVFGVLTTVCVPLFRQLAQPKVQAQLQSLISELGFKGWLLFLLLQITQVVIAFIPGEPIQLLAGVLYGTWGGLITCLLGSVIASTAIFLTVKHFGLPLLTRLFGANKLQEFSFLHKHQRIETVTLLLFLIPGMPKDLLTYLAGITPIDCKKFLAISTLARIPALTASTLIGSSASRGNVIVTLAVSLAAIGLALVGVIYRQHLMSWLHKHP